jgi:hypothetical protein
MSGEQEREEGGLGLEAVDARGRGKRAWAGW